MCSTVVPPARDVYSAHLLFWHTKITGNLHSDARFRLWSTDADIAGSVAEVHNGDLVGVVHLGGQRKTVCDRGNPEPTTPVVTMRPVLRGR